MKLVSETSTPAKRRVRGASKSSAEVRRKLIDSAFIIFGRQGFSRAKTEDVADHAGCSQATIFFHFKTKAGLLNACLEDALERAKANLVLSESSNALDLIQRLDRAFDNSLTSDFFARTLMEFSDDESIRTIYADFHEHVRQLITVELVAETGVDADRCYATAAALLAMMVGVRAEQRLETKRFTGTDFRQMLLAVARAMVRELTAPEGGP